MDRPENPIDLRALSADRDPGRAARVVAAASARISAYPQGSMSLLQQFAEAVARVRWPTLATASAVAVVAIVFGAASPAAAEVPISPSLAAAVGVPDQWVGWIVTQEAPSVGDLIVRLGGP